MIFFSNLLFCVLRKWEILTCDWCGSKGTHEACHSLIKIGRNLVCQDCKEIDDRCEYNYRSSALLSLIKSI